MGGRAYMICECRQILKRGTRLELIFLNYCQKNLTIGGLKGSFDFYVYKQVAWIDFSMR